MKRTEIHDHDIEITTDEIVVLLRQHGFAIPEKYSTQSDSMQKNAGQRSGYLLTFSWSEDVLDTDQWPDVAATAQPKETA